MARDFLRLGRFSFLPLDGFELGIFENWSGFQLSSENLMPKHIKKPRPRPKPK